MGVGDYRGNWGLSSVQGNSPHLGSHTHTYTTEKITFTKCANFPLSLPFEVKDVRWSGIEVNHRGLVEKSGGRNI